MSYNTILSTLFPNLKDNTSPNIPLPGQIANNAGGFGYEISDWEKLDRFLILGSDSGTYYVSAIDLTKQNVEVLKKLLASEPSKVIEHIVEISDKGRAPKNDSALFALAIAASDSNIKTRQLALNALPKVARIGTHLLMFVKFVNNMRGWGRSLRRAIANWFLEMPLEKLILQGIKYSNRDGWGLRDLLRLSHPKTQEKERAIVFNWIAHPDNLKEIMRENGIGLLAPVSNLYGGPKHPLSLLEGKNYVINYTSALPPTVDISQIIRNFSLPREALLTEMLRSKEVWEALLEEMPITAMIRNLGKMGEVGVLAPWDDNVSVVIERLTNKELLKKARIHPFQILLALKTYAQGRGEKGSLEWPVVAPIVEALNNAFELCFDYVEPTNKKILVAIDVSGSMRGEDCMGASVLSCIEAAAAIAMMFVRTEQNVHTIAFNTETYPFPITHSQRLDDIISKVKQWGGGTDLAQPILFALQKQLYLDSFVIITDNETWSGNTHAVQALYHYRAQINPFAKIVVLATNANKINVIDPNDILSLGIAGFDASVPTLVNDFIKN